MADAAFAVVRRDPRACTGNLFLDEDVLREDGVTDFSGYAVTEDSDLELSFFLPEENS
jgi:citronellol/citronellal dehydrogenase